jgi:hypothetical protein
LAASAIGIVIVKAGLIPTKISALGVDFSQADQRTLLWVLLGVVAYFLVMFVVYALSDIMSFFITLVPEVHGHFLKHTRLPDDMLYEHVYWVKGEKYTQKLDGVISKDAMAKFHEWFDLLHQIRELPPERQEKLSQLQSAINELEQQLTEREAAGQPITEDLGAKAETLYSQLRELIGEEEKRVASLREEAERVNAEANALGKEAGKRRDILWKGLFAGTGGPAAITFARLGVDFLVPLVVSVFAIIFLIRGR